MIDEKKLIKVLCELGKETEKQKKNAEKDPQQGMFEFALTNQLAMLNNVIEKVKEQPKIGEWIPCSERLPSKEECSKYREAFIVTVDANGLKTMAMEFEYTTIRGKEIGRWIWYDRVNIPWEVIAWKPLPDPYKG